ncbi:aspartate/glutamate racemase family protein [Glutamicibacter sp. JL.03c]|uniref:aspartate/glutamate racemase family protein n=1 Tax=Glutamicibacter sp. JL.03c TaxID=2984842 RepID=UPI0021F71564|nr:aspartate/glutamate racemase family protein [Glutamicibacter sp. JL.03c]UYQ76556.1 aspartate/glutamate racemase family protein [Glutamicibacter sp. JL.03c]
MLDTSFRRIRGDIGNPASFSYPVIHATVPHASVNRVVEEPDEELITLFIDSGRELERQGATAITTSCGFLAKFQLEIQSGLDVPFRSSSLLQIPAAQARHGNVGVITAKESSLGLDHFLGARCTGKPAAVAGMDSSPAFTSSIIEQTAALDEAAIRSEVIAVARELVRDNPELDAIVLECTNLPPYAQDVRNVTRLPVYDALTMCNELMAAPGAI